MLFIFRLIKALRLKRKLKEYIEERKLSIEDEERKHNCWNRFRGWWKRKCPFFLGGGDTEKTTYNVLEKFRISIFTSGTYENYVLKSVIGFLSGILLTYMFFIFFILQLNFPLGTATTMCSIFGLILSLGLAYSYTVRCVVFMLLPQFFSKRGRQALVAYAFILALTGPAKNTLHNMRILSETMACGQGKLKAAVKNLVDLIKKPFYAIKESMKQVMEKIQVVVEKVKEIINAITRVVKSLIGVIKSAYEWLNSVVSMCSKTAGTPYQRCERAFQQAYDGCVEKVPSPFEGLCEVTGFVQSVCGIVKPIDFICELFDFVSDDIVGYIKKKLREFSEQMKNIFYVSVKFSHTYDFHAEQSKTVKEIAAGIMLEMKQRSEKIVYFFDWMSFVFSFFFLYMLIQVLNYKRKYMTIDWYDNHFITENIVHLDIQRTRMGLETILPLNVHERKKYVHVSSIRLVAAEKRALTKSAVFLCLTTVKLSIHMLADYSLWWVLQMIRYHGQFQTNVDNPSNIKVVVDGKGMLADLYSAILNTFQPTGVKFDLDTSPCLPDPAHPDLSRYKQIASLIVLAWILSICEPYGLRLRNSAMGYYYPARARVRAIWLYNHILRSRGSFLKYARRQLRRMFMKDTQGVEKISFMDRMRAMFPILRKICKGKEFTACFLCGGVGSPKSPLVKCPRPDCIGCYCVSCYGELQNICPLCKLPIEYGDLSDISEERDSSDEIVSSAASKRSEVTSTDESDSTAALLQDTAESELSYGYQYKERDINEDKKRISSLFQDTEAQKPRSSRATLDDYAFPIEHHPEEEEHKMTLAQRRKSGLWSLIPDEDVTPELRNLNDMELGKLKPETFRKSQQDDENKIKGEYEMKREKPWSDLNENLTDPMVSTSSTPRGGKKIQKFFHIPKLKGFHRKRSVEKTGRTQKKITEEESELKKPLLRTRGMELSEDSESRTTDEPSGKPKTKRRLTEGNRVRYLKKKLFGKEKPAARFQKKTQSDQGGDRHQEGSFSTDSSRVSKSSKLVENWVKTGSYQEPEKQNASFQKKIQSGQGGNRDPEESFSTDSSQVSKSSKMVENWVKTRSYQKPGITTPESNATALPEPKLTTTTELRGPSVRFSSIKQAATGLKNLFKRIIKRNENKENEDSESLILHKYPGDDQTEKFIKKQKPKKKKEFIFKDGRGWGLRKKGEGNSSETSSENPSSVEAEDEHSSGKRLSIDRRSISVQRISIVKIEEEARVSMKRTQTPAKIVHERFKFDEFYV